MRNWKGKNMILLNRFLNLGSEKIKLENSVLDLQRKEAASNSDCFNLLVKKDIVIAHSGELQKILKDFDISISQYDRENQGFLNVIISKEKPVITQDDGVHTIQCNMKVWVLKDEIQEEYYFKLLKENETDKTNLAKKIEDLKAMTSSYKNVRNVFLVELSIVSICAIFIATTIFNRFLK
jgi:hypothetical protein